MTLGRPSTYTPEKAQEAKDTILARFSEGRGLAAVARDLGVARSTIYKWAEEDKSLSDILVTAKDSSLAWWEDLVRESSETGKGNAPLIKMHLYNKHSDDYKDRREHVVESKGTVSIDFLGVDFDEDEDIE